MNSVVRAQKPVVETRTKSIENPTRYITTKYCAKTIIRQILECSKYYIAKEATCIQMQKKKQFTISKMNHLPRMKRI